MTSNGKKLRRSVSSKNSTIQEKNGFDDENLLNQKYKGVSGQETYNIYPSNPLQEQAFKSIYTNTITVLDGPPGTGKTLLSIFCLYQMLKKREIDKIVVVRLVSKSNGEDLGALPGEKEDKMLPFAMPIYDNLNRFLPKGEVDYLFNKGKIEVIPVSYLRGRSLSYTGLIVEESQNLAPEMLLTVATRIDKGSRLIFNGDDRQRDIPGRNGMSFLFKLFDGLEDTEIVKFSCECI